MNLPVDTAEYIYEEVLRTTRYLVVDVDDDGMVLRQACPGRAWKIAGLETGKPLPAPLDAVFLTDVSDTGPVCIPYLYLGDDGVADVHIIAAERCRQLILQDVSESHEAECRLQQKAHEVSLLLEKQAELNHELALKREEAEQASQAKSRFIAAMSHEFRTPINSIMGHAELLSRTLGEAARTGPVQRACWHLLVLVENLLEQARLGEGETYLTSSRIDLPALMDDVRQLFELQAAKLGLEFSVGAAPTGVELVSDDLRLRQVLINLLSNALRYTREGRVSLSCRSVDGGLCFEVADTGPGIRPEDHERIFKPFTRLQPSRQSGAGLGLAITRELVDAMGGELVLKSAPGRGSVFGFTLPACANADEVDGQELTGRSILVVDDDEDLLGLFEIVMTDWRMDIVTASGCREARSVLAQRRFDIVMSDLHLADGDGVELLSEVAAGSGGCRTILCSGSVLKEYAGSGMKGVADAFVRKPVAIERLKTHLSAVLGERVSR